MALLWTIVSLWSKIFCRSMRKCMNGSPLWLGLGGCSWRAVWISLRRWVTDFRATASVIKTSSRWCLGLPQEVCECTNFLSSQPLLFWIRCVSQLLALPHYSYVHNLTAITSVVERPIESPFCHSWMRHWFRPNDGFGLHLAWSDSSSSGSLKNFQRILGRFLLEQDLEEVYHDAMNKQDQAACSHMSTKYLKIWHKSSKL